MMWAKTWSFSRVLVVDHGRVIEDGSPQDLYRRADSRYRVLVDAEDAVRERVWSDPVWRKLTMDEGRLRKMRPSTGRPRAARRLYVEDRSDHSRSRAMGTLRSASSPGIARGRVRRASGIAGQAANPPA